MAEKTVKKGRITMKIILVRDGHAEDKKENLDDRLRELTKKGRKRVKKSAQALNEYLDGRNALLWTSPASRAMQTAKIVSKELGISEIAIHDFIYSGETNEGQKALSRLSEEQIVIITGHEDYLGNWAKGMTDEEFSFKKGQIGIFEVNNKTLKGERIWLFPDTIDKK